MNTYPTLRRLASIWILIGFIIATVVGMAGVFILVGGDTPVTGFLVIAGGFTTVLIFQTVSQVLLLLIDMADSLSSQRNSERIAPQIGLRKLSKD